MRLNTAPANAVEMSGISSTSQFKIQASAKAFSILSDGLYANKIRAIVRELSTNALDSHIAAGRADLPFTVNIPNIMAPWFSVRDYGVGLSHDEVISIYTSYFTSTKSDSDDFVGALGLGSKSPFSYTDNFSVTTIKDGRKGLYSAYINDTGVPSIALMSETETDEPNGVEVRLAVDDRDDFYKFAREANYVYQHFAVRPHITGESVEFEEIEYFRKDILPGIHIRQQNGYRHNGRNVIVMGSIEYPIQLPHGALRGSKEISGERLQNIANYGGFEIHVPIGAVEMSASREELSYTSKTVEFICDAYIRIYHCLESVFLEGLEGLENQWDIAEYLIDQGRDHLFVHYAKQYANAHKLPLLRNSGYVYWKDLSFTVKRAEELNINLRVIVANSSFAPIQAARNLWVKESADLVLAYEIRTGRDLLFVDGSQGPSAVTRSRAWCRENFDGTMVLAVPLDRKKPMLWDQFLEDVYNPPTKYIRNLSEFPKAEQTKRAAATPVYEFNMVRSDRPPFYKVIAEPFGTLADIDDDDTQLAYVKLYRSETHINGEKTDVRSHFAHLLKSGLLHKTKIRLFGVRETDIDTVANDENWKQFDVAVKDALGNLTEQDFIASRLNSFDTNWKVLYRKYREELNDSPLAKLADLYDPEAKYDFDRITDLAKAYDDKDINARYEQAEKTINEIVSQYPLIDYLAYGCDPKSIVEYVKLVDNAKGEKA